MRKILFGAALALFTLGVTGFITGLISGQNYIEWFVPIILSGCLLFMVAVAVFCKDVLHEMWAIRRNQNSQNMQISNTRNQLLKVSQDNSQILSSIEKSQAILTSDLQPVNSQTEAIKNQTDVINSQIDLIKGQAVKFAASLKRIEVEQAIGYQQLEAAISLNASLNMMAPLPPMRKTWAIAPDIASFLIHAVFEKRPTAILEIGSGLSTVLISKVLERIGTGSLVALEHEPSYSEQTKLLLVAQGIGDQCTIIDAALMPIQIDNTDWIWYDASKIAAVDKLDFVFVDGPPGLTGKLARYPALPVLADRLADGAYLLLDDTERDDEQEILNRWIREFPVKIISSPKLEKGAVLLQWNP